MKLSEHIEQVDKDKLKSESIKEALEQRKERLEKQTKKENDIIKMTTLLFESMSNYSDKDIVRLTTRLLKDDEQIMNVVKNHVETTKKNQFQRLDVVTVTKKALENVRDAALYNIDKNYGEFPLAMDPVPMKRKSN